MNIARPATRRGRYRVTPRSRGTLYRRICMFNAVSVACAPHSLAGAGDVKYSDGSAGIAAPSEDRAFIIPDEPRSPSSG